MNDATAATFRAFGDSIAAAFGGTPVVPIVVIRSEAWIDLAVLGLRPGEQYVHDGIYRRPWWLPARVFKALARFVIHRVFRAESVSS